ncbi:hypothetical protein [Massilia sp. MS-15]|uniref:hypothetical protein n=1 Tax=Massilia sp. MS-15 TaxID=2878200 RepID=UPI001CD7D946|nr:hypothetical protein [Massilia sp. MS-15]MCA1244998.1 hypothetical protein [Massilia sp. MS-15]
MHIEQVQFDEVFDVQPARGDFSFRCAGRPVYGVNLHSGVIPRPGSRFAVAFGKRGDWNSVLGCRDLASSKVLLRRPGWAASLFSLGDILLFGPLCVGAGLALGGPGIAIATTALFTLAIAAGLVHGLLQNRTLKLALRADVNDAAPTQMQ